MFINALDEIKVRQAEAAANVVVKPAIEIIADPETIEVREDEKAAETTGTAGTAGSIRVPDVVETPEVTPAIKDSNE
jgi:hypothetical protein